jgi:mannosyltransferase
MKAIPEHLVGSMRQTGARLRLHPGVPAICGLGAMVVFLIGISGPSLWIDEGHTWKYANEPLGSMLSAVIGSTNAVEALYYAVLHFWIGVAGTSEIALRLPSAMAMALAVWLASKTAADAAGRRAAFVAGFVMISLPGVTRYAQEARPYAFAVAAVALSTFLLYRGLTRDQRRWWVGYAAALIVVGYFHLLSLLVVAGQFMAVVYTDRARWRAFVASAGVAFVAVLPVTMLGFAQRGQISWIPPVQFDYLWTGYSVMTGSLAVTACIALLVLLGGGDRRLTALGLGTALATPLLLWLLGWLEPLWLGRYLMGAAPGIAILTAGATTTVRTTRLVVLGAILVALVWPQQIAYRVPAAHNQDYRSAAELVATDCSARIIYDGMSEDAMVYYLQQEPCSPSKAAATNRLWIVQAAGPQVTEPGYNLVSTAGFGMAIVTYWVAV